MYKKVKVLGLGPHSIGEEEERNIRREKTNNSHLDVNT